MQNILNKLHKFTSAQEPIKVEFASMSKLESIYLQLNKSIDNAERGRGEVHNAAIRELKVIEVGLNLADEALKEIKDIEVAAKELGLNVDLNKFKSGTSSMKKALEDLSLFYNQVKF